MWRGWKAKPLPTKKKSRTITHPSQSRQKMPSRWMLMAMISWKQVNM
uniref:Uncharacterized protein n=1 Tax=Anguilla anguilla TaxID=7936 RepID=A0A0E9XD21_ANGAN